METDTITKYKLKSHIPLMVYNSSIDVNPILAFSAKKK